jgi:hypothetical protein
MEGEQIPKATMSSFVRKNVQANFNSDFVSSLLFVSKGTPLTMQNSSRGYQIRQIRFANSTIRKLSMQTI